MIYIYNLLFIKYFKLLLIIHLLKIEVIKSSNFFNCFFNIFIFGVFCYLFYGLVKRIVFFFFSWYFFKFHKVVSMFLYACYQCYMYYIYIYIYIYIYGMNLIYIFIIQSMCCKYLLKSIKFLSYSYWIFISDISIDKWGSVIISAFFLFSVKNQVYLCCDDSVIKRESFMILKHDD